ncbi:MAG: hypothetical protein D3910_07345 [Candidatus Electrothrix sp. ATG2]|nr:hypothetical protein [Candidatus Electrothrix sp. ATG2]
MGLDRLSEDDVKFSILGTALNYSDIVEFLGLEDATNWKITNIDKSRTKELFAWIFQRTPDGPPVVRESRQLNSLAKVVSNEQALSALRSGNSLANASELTDEAEEILSKAISDALRKLELAQNQIKRIDTPSMSELEKLRDISRIAKYIGLAIKESNSNDEVGF